MVVLDWNVTMDESAAVAGEGAAWLYKAKVHASRSKHVILAFFNSTGIIYINHVSKDTSVHSNYIVDALGKFFKVFKQKRLEMEAGD
jgi:hypothetical protein